MANGSFPRVQEREIRVPLYLVLSAISSTKTKAGINVFACSRCVCVYSLALLKVCAVHPVFERLVGELGRADLSRVEAVEAKLPTKL